MKRAPIRFALLLATVGAACQTAAPPAGAPRPEAAKIVTSDVARFWTAFDAIKSAQDTMPLRAYIDGGSVGLADFTEARWKNAATLTRMVWPLRAYYASIRDNTLRAGLAESGIRQVYAVADTLIDGAVFPDVYLEVGGMATGGTTSPHGLLIGIEQFSLAPNSPVESLAPSLRSVLHPPDILPAIVAHELVHYQQHYPSRVTLLGQSIREGVADFIGQMLSGRSINESVRAYGEAHETELWAEFEREMNGSDLSRWLYNGARLAPASTRPGDLGYYIGARIAESYYAKAADKHRAIQEILNISDFPAFLKASGYAGR
jgi:hypothetical protein